MQIQELCAIRFPSADVPPLTVLRAEGREAMNELFRLDIVVYGVDIDEASLEPLLLGAQAVLSVQTEAKSTSDTGSPHIRNFAGIVVDVALLGRAEGSRHALRLRVAPRAWLLTKRVGTRIFQDRTAAEIAAIVLGEHRVPHRFRVTGKYPIREYCVQYQETDWEFVSRLFAEEAFFFWFEQPDDAEDETLVIADNPRSYGAVPGPARMRYRHDTGGAMILEEDIITDFRSRAGLESQVLTMRDYDFERPGLDLTSGRIALEAPLPPLGGVNLEHYEHHGEYEETDVDMDNVRATLDQIRARVRTAEGKSVCRRLAPGLVFQLVDHDVATLDRPYVVTAMGHELVAPKVTDGIAPYRNTFEAVPAEVGFCLPKPPRRVRQVLESAVVVGPAGQEIYCDRYGRVKVQFHWDRDGKRNEQSSCFLRVAQTWAGPGFGHQFVPRIGMEVLVSFLGGDPDRPIILGCVPNAFNPPQHGLPEQATRNGIRTRTSPGGAGFNEVTFEDKRGAEQIYVHAQRDLDEEVGLDRTATIARHSTEKIGGDRQEIVAGNRVDETKGDHRMLVNGGMTTTIAGAQRTEIGGHQSIRIDGGQALRVAGQCVADLTSDLRMNVAGDGDLNVEGDLSEIVGGARTVAVAGPGRMTYSSSCALNIGGGISLSVGSKKRPASASGTLSGELVLRGSGVMEIASEKRIRLRVGKTVLTLGPDEVRIESQKISLSAKTIEALGEKGILSVGKEAVLKGDAVRLGSKDNAILELDQEAKLDGQAVKIKPGLAAEMAKREEREEQAGDVEKAVVKLFDLAGDPISNAPYEVSFFGYFDEGESPDGSVAIPKYPDVDKALVRWGRPKAKRENPNDEEQYEYQMEVFLQTDVDDAHEALRRKLHNLGHQGPNLAAAIHHYQRSAGKEATGQVDHVRGEVHEQHGSASPVKLGT